MIQETTHDSTTGENDDLKENNEIVECVNFSCDMPIMSGRGYMEVSTFSVFTLIIDNRYMLFIRLRACLMIIPD